MLNAKEMFTPTVQATPKAAAPAVLKESKTNNGIRVISLDNGAASVTVNVAILAGSRAGTAKECGFAHVLATTAFAGTKNQTGLRMMRTLENHGAKVSASASREAITYTLSCTDNVVGDCVRELADAICNPVGEDKNHYITDAILAAKVTAKDHNDCGDSQLEDLLHDAAFGAMSPLGAPVIDATAHKAKVGKLMAFRSRNFTAGNTIITGTGISHENLKALVDANFSGLKGPASPVNPSPFEGGEAKVRADLGGATHIGLAFPVSSADAPAFAVLAQKLSASAAKGVVAFHNQFRDQGLFGIKVSADNVKDANALLQGAVESIKKVSVSEGDVKRAALSESNLVSSAITGVASGSKASVSQAAAAAKAALSGKFAYAVYGATAGTASHASVAALLK